MTSHKSSASYTILPLSLLLAAFGLAGCNTDTTQADTVSEAAAVESQADPALEERVREAAEGVYFHGMTKELALEVAGYEAVPVLRQLLADPTFERPDNVVMMLGFLGDDEVIDELITYFEKAEIDWANPDHERGLHLVPQMLGHAVDNGSQTALDYLLEVTEDGSKLAAIAARSPEFQRQLDKLMSNAMVGLANSKSPIAEARLHDLSTGAVSPRGGDFRNVTVDAVYAIEQFEWMVARTSAVPDSDPWELFDQDAGEENPHAGPAPLDSNGSVHLHGMTVANHINTNSKVTNSRADQINDSASEIIGTGDFNTDVVCCNMMERSGNVDEFGSNGDGLDTIGNSSELDRVLPGFGDRVKVVDQINYCGGFGSGILGCAYTPGFGMALVRMNTVRNEGLLWGHEYGHNVGLPHSGSSNNLMYAYHTGNNDGLTQSQCNDYHNPSGWTNADRSVIGSCTDVDDNDVHDVLEGGGDPVWNLDITGTCPGFVSIQVSGGTPNGDWTGFSANNYGFNQVADGPCAGTQTELFLPKDRGTRTLDSSGSKVLGAFMNSNLCGLYVQALDVSTCTMTSVAQIPN